MRKAYLQIGALFLVLGWATGALGIETSLGNVNVNSHGYVNLGMTYGIAGKHHDTQEGFQSAVFNLLTENEFKFNRNIKAFVSAMLTGDLAYPILDNDRDWQDRGFDDSEDELYLDTDLRDLLQEAHMTWTPGNFFLRAGKQIVQWGEMDVFRIMDQINPLDQSRGIGDVEFETTILPLWLVRAEYYVPTSSNWLNDFGLEFVFNPNADFRPNRGLEIGNDVGGIWAPNVELGPGTVLGSFDDNIDEPDEWDSEGFDYAFRAKANIRDSLITFNYYYGRAHAPVRRVVGPPRITVAGDGVAEIHLPTEGHYPRIRNTGVTYTTDVPWMSSSALGGVAPAFRIEALYGFDTTFATALTNRFVKRDEFHWGIGVDWKIKLPILNERAYFYITPQITNRMIIDYPDQEPILSLEDDNYNASLLINTSYFHNKVIPSFVWARDITNKSDLWKYQVTYDPNSSWSFTAGALLFSGEGDGKGFDVFDNKDQLYANMTWKF